MNCNIFFTPKSSKILIYTSRINMILASRNQDDVYLPGKHAHMQVLFPRLMYTSVAFDRPIILFFIITAGCNERLSFTLPGTCNLRALNLDQHFMWFLYKHTRVCCTKIRSVFGERDKPIFFHATRVTAATSWEDGCIFIVIRHGGLTGGWWLSYRSLMWVVFKLLTLCLFYIMTAASFTRTSGVNH